MAPRRKKDDKVVKVACYDGPAIQRALDDILLDFLFQKHNRGVGSDSKALPLVEVTWYKDLLIGLCVVAVGLAVWLYFKAAISPRIFYIGGLVAFAVLYLLIELFRMFWVRGVACVTRPKRRIGTKAKDDNAYLLPSLRITTKMLDFSPTYELTASWGKGEGKSCTLKKDVNEWIDVNGVVQKDRYCEDVVKFLDEVIEANSKKPKKQ